MESHGLIDEVRLRPGLKPGDLGTIVRLHGTIYAAEQGFDVGFEAYVAGPLAEFAVRSSDRERIWIAERPSDGRMLGCVAVVAASERTAQLRWFLITPEARGQGLGRRLLDEALAYCRASGYVEVVLWTGSVLEKAARLYRAAGFQKTEEHPGRRWGVDVVEEKYELRLG